MHGRAIMEMKRIEADTLEEAYSQAAKELKCSVTEINYEIVQHPTSGMMGLFKKPAIIIAVKKVITDTKAPKAEKEIEEQVVVNKKTKQEELKNISKEEVIKEEIIEEVVPPKEPLAKKSFEKEIALKEEQIVDDFFTEEKSDSPIVESEEAFEDDRDTPENKARSIEIEKKIQTLMKAGCFDIDTVEVDVFNGIAHIFIDGDDAALLIGKEGYRYNALSYMLFNWINAEYDLYIKLEIAEFIQAQEKMIDSYLKPIAEHIKEHGKGKTKPLDGILVQIALEKLRAMFPNKYIAIKTGKDAKKFIIINDFNTRKN
jgi:spoIIIJ-associated protein